VFREISAKSGIFSKKKCAAKFFSAKYVVPIHYAPNTKVALSNAIIHLSVCLSQGPNFKTVHFTDTVTTDDYW